MIADRPNRHAWSRAISLLLWAAIAVACLVMFLPLLTDRAALALGPWRLRSHDPWRPLSIALACAGLLALLRARGGAARRLSAALLLAGAVAVALATSLQSLPAAFPTGDAAIAELYVLYATRFPWPLGPYSQYYWHHPGPAMFYALAPLYAAAGHHPFGLNLGAAVINIAAVACSFCVASRRLPPLALLGVYVSLAVWLARTLAVATSFWNPHLILFPLFLFIWLAVAVAEGVPRLLPVLTAVGSFLVQSHVGVLPVVAGLGIVAIARGWATPGDVPASVLRFPWRRAYHQSLWVAAIFWALPLAEQLISAPGNLRQLLAFFWERREMHQRFTDALAVWAFSLGGAFVPDFRLPIGWGVPVSGHPLAVAAAIGQSAGLAFIVWRLRWRRDVAVAAGCALAANLLTLAAVDRLPGEIHDHAVFWIGVVGVVGWGLLAGTLAAMVWPRLDDALRPKLESHRVWATAMVTAAAALLIGGQIWRTLDWSGEPTGSAAQVRQLYAGTTEALRVQRVSRPLVRIQSEVWAESAGTVLQLYKDGMPFAVERRWLHMYGPPLAAYGCEYTHSLHFVAAGGPDYGDVVARAGGVAVRLEPLPGCWKGDPE